MRSVFKSTDIDDSGRKIVNHSGRVNQAVMWQSAHRVNCVRTYKRHSLQQEYSVSKVLNVSHKVKCDNTVNKNKKRG